MIRVLGFKQQYRPNGKAIDMVHFTSGDAMRENGEPTHSTWERISRIMPPEVIENDEGGLKLAALRSQWAQIEPAYAAWKSGHEIPETGTPLGAWPAIDNAQAEALKGVGIKTIEDVANATENLLAKPPLPHMRELQRQAKTFLEGADKAAQAAEIAALKEQNAAMLEMLAEQKQEQDKPRRGRPPKAKSDEQGEAA